MTRRRGQGIRRDPVCGRRMTRNGAHIVIEHGGETHYLCCPQCQSEFERDPDRYVRRQRPAPSLREV
ncbi:MAG TPA: YHS domain-containing protein [bacterium]|nr:YHS domain-containing protein [bacterium]